jgi:hypothetical protein
MADPRSQSSDPPKPPSKTDKIAAKSADGKKRERLIDDAVEDSFPASDPPSYMGGATTGAPKKRPRKPDEAHAHDDRE